MTKSFHTHAPRRIEEDVPGRTSASDSIHAVPDRRLQIDAPDGAAAQIAALTREPEARPSRKRPPPLQPQEPALRDFLEDAAVGIHWLGEDGTVLWANRTELALLGYDASRFTGHRFAEFLKNPEALTDVLARLQCGQSVAGWELEICCGDGIFRWFRIDASPWIRKGRFVYARCFLLDISQKREADEARMRLAAIVASSDDAIASKDLTGIITSWNAAAERILGYKAEEIVGKSILTIIPPELHGDEPEILRKIQAGERIEHFETVRVCKSGERINVSLTVSPVRDQHGTIIGAAKILRDVTEQKKLESALRTTERLASVGRLAATVAHEINNPLEAVTNLLYIACRDPGLPESARACLTAADEELRRVAHIARQTLGFYRDTSSPVTLPVARAIDEILAIYDRRFRYKEIQVILEIPTDLSICILQGEFKQIVSNLVSNAIDASPRGCRLSVRAWASCHPHTGAPGVRFVVADQGTGIPKSLRQKIFTPFFTTKRDVGTGLGLWIVRDLLLRRGGSILCRSRSGGPRTGTIMMVFVPSEGESATYQPSAELRSAAD